MQPMRSILHRLRRDSPQRNLDLAILNEEEKWNIFWARQMSRSSFRFFVTHNSVLQKRALSIGSIPQWKSSSLLTRVQVVPKQLMFLKTLEL